MTECGKTGLGERVLIVFFALLGLACAIGAEEPAILLQKDYLGVTGYPRIVGYGLAAFCLLSAPAILRKASAIKIASFSSLRLVAGAMALSILYVCGIIGFGFAISTFVYLWAMPFFLEGPINARQAAGNLAYAILLTAVIEIFFHIFKVYQPQALFF